MDKRGARLIETIFDTDNFFMQICEKILDLATVNLLFLLTSLPLLTIGIAKLSLYQTLFEIKGGRRVKVTAVYIKAFRENWQLGFKLGLLELMLSAISIFDLLLIWGQEALPFQILKVACFALLIFTTALFLCVYPLAGRFEQSLIGGLQTSLVLLSLNFPWFFLMIAILVAILTVLLSSGLLLLLGLSLFVLIGFAGLAFTQITVLEKIFAKYEKP
ncbi:MULTISPECIES: DUF624 domain-containing protein [Streptococcus]|jgi:hypothetical membrane spanning protein|uniref:DUF624 domain-containing protein n=2 Tax=Streptococcus sanguinis TaxID=1305 RepID=A0A2X3YHW1_STRSA|nr:MULTISPECIES: DUF624 domain-containing protein [Streptococcus]MBF1690323.1 DUF624 domain-containing protein [Streptococcus cristatus]EGJ38008.1 hypothetical protein HMPREF9393_1790 [Streptococcus sanguinis SK1056]MBZ2021673.1 DUF624 domain-containing protein [Streptococcus sanguinis]MBZ2038663.1 DUF624 domain-containing protein [Streptococcus sanguinis]MBZ2057947.1 DUF624 domain-containing protein [Streptococcus sanguinis]